MNIFSGARRIGAVLGIAWLCGVGLSLPTYNVALRFDAFADSIGSQFTVTRSKCPPSSSLRRFFVDTALVRGRAVEVNVCFETFRRGGGESVLSFFNKEDSRVHSAVVVSDSLYRPSGLESPDEWNERTLAEAYLRRVVNSVRRITGSEGSFRNQLATAVRDAIWRDRWAWLKSFILIGVGGIVAGYAMMFGLGWIVRGFMGIPMGKDAKEKKAEIS